MKILTYKNLNMGETIINFLFLLFQQAFFLIFILIVINLTIVEFNNEEIGVKLFLFESNKKCNIQFFYL